MNACEGQRCGLHATPAAWRECCRALAWSTCWSCCCCLGRRCRRRCADSAKRHSERRHVNNGFFCAPSWGIESEPPCQAAAHLVSAHDEVRASSPGKRLSSCAQPPAGWVERAQECLNRSLACSLGQQPRCSRPRGTVQQPRGYRCTRERSQSRSTRRGQSVVDNERDCGQQDQRRQHRCNVANTQVAMMADQSEWCESA